MEKTGGRVAILTQRSKTEKATCVQQGPNPVLLLLHFSCSFFICCRCCSIAVVISRPAHPSVPFLRLAANNHL